MSDEVIEGEGILPISDEDKRLDILKQLLEPKKVDFHTEIENPYKISQLELLADFLDSENYEGEANMIREFVKYLKKNFVPFKRKRAEEIVKALIGTEEEENEGKEALKRLSQLIK